MTETNQPQQKSRLFAMAAVLLAVIAVLLAGWMYKKNMPTDTAVAPVAEQTTEAPVTSVESASSPADATSQTVSEPAQPIDIAKAMGVRAMGKPDAPIKIIEYASLTCSHCAHFHNDVFAELKEKYIDTGSVYFEFREFPLNAPALQATVTARCLPEEKYVPFIEILFKNQDQWAGGLDYMAALRQNAKLAGLSDAQFDACQNNADMKTKIAERMKEAQEKYKVESTPTFVVNDGQEVIKGAVPIEEFERVFRKVSNNVIGVTAPVE